MPEQKKYLLTCLAYPFRAPRRFSEENVITDYTATATAKSYIQVISAELLGYLRQKLLIGLESRNEGA